MHIWGNPLAALKLFQIHARELEARFDPGPGKAFAEFCVRLGGSGALHTHSPGLPCSHRSRSQNRFSAPFLQQPAHSPPLRSQRLPAAAEDALLLGMVNMLL